MLSEEEKNWIREEGREEGREDMRNLIMTIAYKYREGKSIQQIADGLHMDISKVKKLVYGLFCDQ